MGFPAENYMTSFQEAKTVLQGWQDGCSYTDEQLSDAIETAIKMFDVLKEKMSEDAINETLTKAEIVEKLEDYTIGRPKKERVFITVEELQNIVDRIAMLKVS